MTTYPRRTRIFILLALLFVVTIIYHTWFYSFKILTDGDWSYLGRGTMNTLRIDYFSLWLSDTNFGRVLIDVGQAPVYALYGAFSKFLNIPFEVSTRLIHFWPIIILNLVSSFLLIRYLFKDFWTAILGSIVFSFNTYMIHNQTGHVTIGAAISLFPLILYFLLKAFETRAISYSIATGLALIVATWYEPRVAYIIAWIMVLYTIFAITKEYKQPLKTHLKTAILAIVPFALTLLANIFWIIPFSQIKNFGPGNVLGKDLFGDEFVNIQYALTLHHPYWSGAKPQIFDPQIIAWYFWLIPLFAIFGLIINRKNKFIQFFALIALLGVILTKQSDSPFPDLYRWLYIHFPGFSAYRESSKFFSLIALSYSVLISSVFFWFKRSRFGKQNVTSALVFCLLAVVFVINLIPVANTNITSLFKPRTVDADYSSFNTYVNNDNASFYTLWAPHLTRWFDYTAQHPRLSLKTLLGTNYNYYSTYSPDTIESTKEEDKITQFIESPNFNDIISDSNIKYIAIPENNPDNADTDFVNYPNGEEFRNKLIDLFKNDTQLEEVNDLSLSHLKVYRNKTFSEYAYPTSNILDIKDKQNLDQKYNFVETSLGKEFDFVENTTGNFPKDTLVSGYENLSSSNLDEIKSTVKLPFSVSSEMKAGGDYSLYLKQSGQSLYYTYLNDRLDLFAAPLKYNGNFDNSSQITQLGSVDLDQSKNYVANLDNITNTIEPGTHYLGDVTSTASTVKVYSIGSSIIPNGNYEKGLWQKTVGDCNNFDSNARLDMSIKTDNTNYLSLSAGRHIACTDKIIDLPKDSNTNKYLFSLDYASPNTSFAEFRISQNLADLVAKQPDSFDPTTNTYNFQGEDVFSRKIPINNPNEWSNFQEIYDLKPGIEKLDVSLYAQSQDDGKLKENNYDNAKLIPLTEVRTFQVNITKQYQNYSSSEDISNVDNLSISSPFAITQHLKDPEFNNDSGNNRVGNCNHYDNNPVISMKNVVENDNHFLRLSAARHIACVTSSILVRSDQNILLQYDFRTTNTNSALVSYSFDDGISNQSKSIEYSNKDSLQTHSEVISTPNGVRSFSLVLEAAPKTEGESVSVDYDNVKIYTIPKISDSTFLYRDSKSGASLDKQPKITTTKREATIKTFAISNIQDNFYLNMSETYNANWKLYTDKGVALNAPHGDNDRGLNTWFINKADLCGKVDCNTNITLLAKFEGQNLLNILLPISVLSVIVPALYLIYLNQDYMFKRGKKAKVVAVTPKKVKKNKRL